MTRRVTHLGDMMDTPMCLDREDGKPPVRMTAAEAIESLREAGIHPTPLWLMGPPHRSNHELRIKP